MRELKCTRCKEEFAMCDSLKLIVLLNEDIKRSDDLILNKISIHDYLVAEGVR